MPVRTPLRVQSPRHLARKLELLCASCRTFELSDAGSWDLLRICEKPSNAVPATKSCTIRPTAIKPHSPSKMKWKRSSQQSRTAVTPVTRLSKNRHRAATLPSQYNHAIRMPSTNGTMNMIQSEPTSDHGKTKASPAIVAKMMNRNLFIRIMPNH